jgi:SAM-dependent methyltransferase
MSPRSDEQAAQYFHRIADEWDAIYAGEQGGLNGLLNRVFRKDMWLRYVWVKELMEQAPRGSVLDIGCGNGIYSIALARQGHRPILAMDLAPAAIEKAAAGIADAELSDVIRAEVGDAFFGDYEGRFDVALAIGVLDYVGDPLPALKSVTARADRLLATFPRAETWRAPVRKLRLTLRGCPVYFYRRQALADLVTGAGWRVASWTTYGCLHCLDLRLAQV